MSTPHLSPSSDYSELRFHDARTSTLVLVDGNLTTNTQTEDVGTSARTYLNGYWGFAAGPETGDHIGHNLSNKANANARVMARFGHKNQSVLPEAAYRGEHIIQGKTPYTQKESIDLLKSYYNFCKEKYPDLASTTFRLHSDKQSKYLATSFGSQCLSTIQRAVLSVVFTVLDDQGKPVKLGDYLSGKGTLADLNASLSDIEPLFEGMYQHVQAKRTAVSVRGGLHTIVLAPALAGMLAHEAMGHPCEADSVLGGAVTGELLGKPVASDLITMVDFAHSYEGQELMMPVYADDEGTPAADAVMIKKGILNQFMNSRQTAAMTGGSPTGNARAFSSGDEPLVRMRNTAILPGSQKLNDMIAGVEDGYYLMRTGNGQADSTTEFMFGITLGYEIKNGYVGRAIRDTTISGNAIKMLSSVDAVSDDMYWSCAGYCGKKQRMVVSMGGPALRGVAHLGGE